jgi:dihydropteroate synthase
MQERRKKSLVAPPGPRSTPAEGAVASTIRTMKPADFDRWLLDAHRPPLVMGVLNVTPDSFSDGGKFAAVDAAVAHAHEMVEAGADWIDIGGESTRPGSSSVPADEQIRRVEPVIRAIASLPVILSIDTTKSQVAQAAIDAGAAVINDISAARDDAQMLPLAAMRRTPLVLMHMQGTPQTMQDNPTYADVIPEVIGFLKQRIGAAVDAGVDIQRILIDPGIGFGKQMPHNLQLLRRQSEFTALGRPMVIGASRKGFIGRITGESEPSGRLFGTAACVAWSIANGASIVRVHDVRPMRQVVAVIRAIQTDGKDSEFLTSK